jgi:hypothetical protein
MELTMMITEQELKKIILEELSKKRKKRKKNISAPPGAPGGGSIGHLEEQEDSNEPIEASIQRQLSDAIKTNDIGHILQAVEFIKLFGLKIIVLKEPKYDPADPNRFEPFEKYWKRTGMGEPVEGAIKITNVQIEEMMDLKSDIKEPELAQKYKEALSYLIYDNGKRRSGINYDTERYFKMLFK